MWLMKCIHICIEKKPQNELLLYNLCNHLCSDLEDQAAHFTSTNIHTLPSNSFYDTVQADDTTFIFT